MRILFFIESLRSGGKERRMIELIKAISNEPDIKMAIVLSKDIVHYEEIRNYNVKIYYTIRKGLKKDPRVFINFYKIAKEFKPDVIHVWGNLVAIYAIPAKILLGIPMINNQITDAPEVVSKSLLSHKLTFPFSNRIIANSNAGLDAYSAPKGKSQVIYNGFNFERLNNLTDKKETRTIHKIKTELVIGMVASFSDKKDYATYIKAANAVLQKIDNVGFICIGSGDDDLYKAMVDEKHKDKVLFLGKQSGVESIMNVCDIGVLATFTEGISNALLEFAALGKPVITTFGGGNVELVEQDKTGFLIEQRDANALAEKLLVLIKDESLRESMGKKAKTRIENTFSIQQMKTNFLKAYKSVING